MSDNPEQKPPEQTPNPQDENEFPDWAKDPKRAVEMVKQTREEAKQYRLDKSELEKKFESILDRLPKDDEKKDEPKDIESRFEARFEKIEKMYQSEVERREKAERDALITRVAAAHHLPAELAARLRGSTEEELIEDAKQLAKFAPKKEEEQQQSLFSGRMITGIPGGQPSSGQKEDDMRARLFGVRKEKPSNDNSGNRTGRIQNW